MDDVGSADLAEVSTIEPTMDEKTLLSEEDHHPDHHPEQDEHHKDEVTEVHGEKAVAETELQGQEAYSAALDDVRTEGPVASETEPERTVRRVTGMETAALYAAQTKELVVSEAETEHNLDQAREKQPRGDMACLDDVPTEEGEAGVAAALDDVRTEKPEDGEGIEQSLAQQQLDDPSPDKSEVVPQPIEAVKTVPPHLDGVSVVSGTEPELAVDQVIEKQPVGTDAAALNDVQRDDPEEGEGKEECLAHLVQWQVSGTSPDGTEIAPHDDERNPTEAFDDVPPPLYDVNPLETSDSALHPEDLTEEGMVQSAEHVPEKIFSADHVVCSVEDSDLAPQCGEGFHIKIEANGLGEDIKLESDSREENLEVKTPVLTIEPVREVEMLNSAIAQAQVPSFDREVSVDAAHKEVSTYTYSDKEAVNWDVVKNDANDNVADQSIVADTRKEDLDAFEGLGSNRKEHEEQPLMEGEHGVALDDRQEAVHEGCLGMEGASATEVLGSNRDEHEEEVLKEALCAAFLMDREEAVKEETLVLEDAYATVSALSARKVPLMPLDGNGDTCADIHLVEASSMDFSSDIEDEAQRKNVQEDLPVQDVKGNGNVVKQLLSSNDQAVGMSLPSVSAGQVAQEEFVARDEIKVEEVSTRHLPYGEPCEVTRKEAYLSESVSREVIVDGPSYDARSSAVNGPTASSFKELDKDRTQLISHVGAASQDDVGYEEANKFVSGLKVPLMFAAGAAIAVGLAIAMSRRH